MSNPAYVDNQVPFGAFTADIKRGPTATATTIITAAVFEQANFQTPTNNILRPNQIGGPNGFVMVNTQETGSCTVQLPLATTETPKNGDWISYVRDGKTGATAETWVLHNIGDPWESTSYRKFPCSLIMAHTPP